MRKRLLTVIGLLLAGLITAGIANSISQSKTVYTIPSCSQVQPGAYCKSAPVVASLELRGFPFKGTRYYCENGKCTKFSEDYLLGLPIIFYNIIIFSGLYVILGSLIIVIRDRYHG